MALVQRLIEVAVRLAGNAATNQPSKFSESGTDTVTIRDARTSVRIQNSGAPAGSTAHVDIFGLAPSLMDQLSTLGLVFNIVPRNTITIQAGDTESGLSTVFAGTIVAGYGDYNAAPNVPFRFEANAGLESAVAPAPVTSFRQATDVATIMAGFARQMSLGFENNGVSVMLPTPYFSGTVETQLRACAQAANINAEIVNGGNVLAIWPKGGNRNTPSVPLIAPPPSGQMIGYPSYTQQGIIVKTVFDPKIAFGGLVRVQSSLKPATGTWAVQKLDLALDSKMPGGQWSSTIYAYNPNYPKPIPPGA